MAAGGAQCAGVLQRGDRAVLGEGPLVAAGDLTAVQNDREDLAVGHPRFDAPASERRIQRVAAAPLTHIAEHSDRGGA